MSSTRQLHLNLLFSNAGNFSSAWRWPASDPRAFIDIGYYTRVAQLAERGTIDAVFLADHPALSAGFAHRPFQSLEPTVAIAAMAMATRHIGFIATASSSYNEPYNIARRFASLDHISAGRVGINIVTTAKPRTAGNFGADALLPHGERYRRAEEFAEVLNQLWDSWEDGALLADQASGRFVDANRIHAVRHKGEFFAVEGALNVPRSPQGRPVLVQAGSSDDGRNFAARHAELVFIGTQSLEEAISYRAGLAQRAHEAGRDGAGIRVMPGLVTVIGATEALARQRHAELLDLLPFDFGLERLSETLRVDLSKLDLDKPLPEGLPIPPDANQTAVKAAFAMARRNRFTVRELVKAQGAGGTVHQVVVGTPEQIADRIQTWFDSGAIDGFNVVPDAIASGLEDFVDGVVPELRRRGIFRSAYAGSTLRDHLGLQRPAGITAQTSSTSVEATA